MAEGSEPIDTLRTRNLQGVVVRSTRADSKTPMAFSTLDKGQIARLNTGRDVPYMLSFTPSVTTTSDAGNGIGYTSIRVRGIDPTRINITANGVPVNDAESSLVYWVNTGDLVSSLQSMQLQRGAGTSTNGAGAFGATLNLQTENLTAQPYFGLDLSGGSYYSHKETVRFGTGLLGEHWAVQGRLSNIGSKGYLRRASTKLNSYFLQGGYLADNTVVKFITWNGTEQTYHAWNYTSKYEQSLFGRRYNSCGEYYDDEGNVHYYKDQIDDYHQQNYQLVWNQELSRFWNTGLTLHYTKGHGFYNQYKAGDDYSSYGLAATEFESDLTRKKIMDNDLYGGIVSVNYDDKSKLKATLGGGWNKYIGDHWGEVLWTKEHVQTFYPGYEYYRNRAWKTDFNVYAKGTWTFVPGVSAFADLQYRHVGYRMEDPRDYYTGTTPRGYWAHDDFDFFNPKAGLNWQITPHHRAYASYAMSHKEPTRNDYQDNEVTHLKAEKLQDIEVGYKYQSQRFTAGVNLYYMYYNHQYVLTGELNSIGEAIASNSNSGRSYREGVEIEAAWQPLDWFRWDANATFARSINKDWTVTLDDGTAANLGNTKTTFSPNVIFNNIFKFNYKGFELDVMSRYVGRQNLTNTDLLRYNNYTAEGTFDRSVDMFLKAQFTTDIDLSYRFALKSFGLKDATVGLTLYNVFNKKYDNNGWASPKYRRTADGRIEAYRNHDLYEAGFAPSAPFNMMAHLSLNF